MRTGEFRKMAAPRELSLEAIRIYMLENGGKVTNHDLVKHFKRFLTNPETRDEARNQFKEYVNTLATIRNEDGEKCLVLKKRFRPEAQLPPPPPAAPASPSVSMSSSCSVPSLLSMSSESLASSVATSPPPPPPPSGRLPPPYRPPPPPAVSPGGGTPPPPTAPPRRRSSDRLLLQEGAAAATTAAAAAALAAAGHGQVLADGVKRPKTMGAETPPPAPSVTVSPTSPPPPQHAQQPPAPPPPPPPQQQPQAAQAPAQPAQADAAVSVKERTQRFQRLASESDLLRVAAPAPSNALTGRRGAADDDSGDSVSVTTLDVRAREWLVRAAQADHLQLTKLANEDPRLPRLRDPSSTALHWGAKHGNEHVIKLIAGTHRADVNARTGYTPAHIAMQFNHENIFSLLVEAYGADPNLRDWSGRKPRQYLANQDTAVSADTFRKIKARKKQSEKELGFLRIGSLNMRVKRTTEAFSNFLGVGTTNSEKLHKSWGSADNIQQVDRRIMPPPKVAPIKKRGSRRGGQDYSGSHSTPSTPPSHTRTAHDSDSDTACGFGSDWQVTS